MSDDPQKLSIGPTNMTLLGARKLYGIGEKSVEDRLYVRGRAGDHTKNLAVAVCCSNASRNSELEDSSSAVLLLTCSNRLMFSTATPI